ncbi:RAD52 family DNA repair protein [Alkalihalobacillus oceani]|uniref:RAD52 family DNA repair protein n=1 Tax=Halalkalibacter oceani TaxID=1653776 RepID=A0A9X2DU05_9BACI|nr:Rad52/Rad22 family DNA repair protein [Halalkalibacter oceani]MCM3715482.1 RAD52 family DNA repair protein [Halalkalibacter oceani]
MGDQEDQFARIIDRLCRPFPKSVLKDRNDKKGSYISSHTYIQRLNEAAGPYWSHERIGEPVFYPEDQLVHIKVKVTIMGRSHEGEGFTRYKVHDNNHIKNRHYAIRSAIQDGIRDAITFFGVEKPSNHDQKEFLLDEYKPSHQSQIRECLKCNKELNSNDLKVLENNNHVKHDYCETCIPKHLRKT